MKVFHVAPIRKPLHPALMMVYFWAGMYALYLLAPIVQTPTVSLQGFGFVVMLVALFGVAAGIGASHSLRQNLGHVQERPLETPAFRLLNLLLVIGIVGGVASICAKVNALQELSLAGFVALRNERANELIATTQQTHAVLSALGFLCYPAGFVAVVIMIARYEQTRMFSRGLTMMFFVVVFVLSIAFGGRSMIFVLILFVALGAYLRRCRGLAMIPRSKSLRRMLIGLVLLFVAYSAVIWQVRASLNNMDIADSLQYAERVWGVKPSPSLEWL
ncbi:MAG: hypothetical protein JSS58_08135, partial [Proteobacteria bacterium]|nr:hypothetical protein [Pseudomonadota bacterium]